MVDQVQNQGGEGKNRKDVLHASDIRVDSFGTCVFFCGKLLYGPSHHVVAVLLVGAKKCIRVNFDPSEEPLGSNS